MARETPLRRRRRRLYPVVLQGRQLEGRAVRFEGCPELLGFCMPKSLDRKARELREQVRVQLGVELVEDRLAAHPAEWKRDELIRRALAADRERFRAAVHPDVPVRAKRRDLIELDRMQFQLTCDVELRDARTCERPPIE